MGIHELTCKYCKQKFLIDSEWTTNICPECLDKM